MTDLLDDAKIPIDQLPGLFGVSRSTIKRWLAAGNFPRHPYDGNEWGDKPGKAVRYGDIMAARDENTGHWMKRGD